MRSSAQHLARRSARHPRTTTPAPAASAGPAATNGSIQWWFLSTRPVRAASPWCWISVFRPVGSTVGTLPDSASPMRLSTTSTRSAAISISQWAARPSLYLKEARRITPDSPFGGSVEPKTGVSRPCSIERSRGTRSGCCSGSSQRVPVAPGSKRSRGTEGRSLGSRSAPQPGIRACSSSREGARLGLSAVYGTVASSVLAHHDEGLDAVVELGGEQVVALGDVLQRDPVGDDVGRLEVAAADVLEEPGPLALDRALVHLQGQPLVHRVAELHR